MAVPDDLVPLADGFISLGVGLFVIAVGIGLATVPPSVPLLGVATQIAAAVYFVIGGLGTLIGGIVVSVTLTHLLGKSPPGRGGFTRR